MRIRTSWIVSSLLTSAFAQDPWLQSRAVNYRPESIDVQNAASLVNLFVGTTLGGHVFPGATIPHGMVKVGMDTDSPGNQAGYDADATFNAIGFSQLHDDGTGGGSSLSNFKIWPISDCSNFADCPTSINERKKLRKILSDGSPDDAASPGYFASNLSTNVRVELTSTKKVALHRYTFPAGTAQPRILVDIIDDGLISGANQTVYVNSTSGRVTGGAGFLSSFGPETYKAYTCVDFKGDGYNVDSPTESGLVPNSTSPLGALLTFPLNSGSQTTTVLVRVGVSFISAEQACSNAESEVPTWDFDGIRQASWMQWNELLGRVKVDPEGVDPETVILLYSSLYRIHIAPADYTGENPKWNSTEPYYDSFYCNWDTYRTLFPLMSMHDPVTFAQIVRGMIDIQRHEGWLPECRGSTTRQWVQGGSNGDPILGEFFVKFHDYATKLQVSADDLYTALLADAETQPDDWDLAGREVNIWKSLGYVPSDDFESGGMHTRQVSRSLEYAFDDFSIAQVAQILGKTDDAAKYYKRAGNFVNLWNPNITVPGHEVTVGMMQPRFANGTWNYTDPRHCSVNDPTHSTCFLNKLRTDGFYESSPLVYSQYVPQDNAKLIELQGGPDSFVARLNFIFEQNYFDSTDEPSQQIPYMYHYANRPGLSTQTSRQVIATGYNTSINGLPGNDDSGAMGSFAFFFLAGLYPLPATRQLLLSSPYFPNISFYNPLYDKTTTIKVNNFVGNPSDGTGGTVFVKSVKIDGKNWKSNCYIDWDAFVAGSTIELEVTDDINVGCGSDLQALPPSLSTGGYN